MNQAAAQQDDKTIEGEITVVKPDNALVVMDPIKYAAELFEPFRAQLAQAKRRASREKYDITTKAGMATAKELRAAFVKIRTTADKSKTEAKRPIDQAGKLILSEFQTLAAAVKAEEDKHDAAIVAEEKRLKEEQEAKIAAERARVEAIENRIASLRAPAERLAKGSSAEIRAAIDTLSTMRLNPDDYQEYLEEALTAVNDTIDKMEALFIQARDREEAERLAAENARELARLQSEKAEREAREKKEADERERQAKRNADIAERISVITNAPMRAIGYKTAAEIANLSEELLRVTFNENTFGERLQEAITAEKNVQSVLTTLYEAAVAREQTVAKVATESSAPPPVMPPVKADGLAIEIVTDDSGTDGVATTAAGAPLNRKDVAPPPPMRPRDMAIVSTLAANYAVEQKTVVKWLLDMDLAALSKQFDLV